MAKLFGRHWRLPLNLGQHKKGKQLAASVLRSLFNTHCGRRFPVVSGLKVTWDSRRPPGQRVLSVALLKGSANHDNGSPERPLEEEPILKQKDGRKYAIVTRDYLAEGHDGFVALKGKPYLIDHENGSLMSGIVRKYLLGKQSFS